MGRRGVGGVCAAHVEVMGSRFEEVLGTGEGRTVEGQICGRRERERQRQRNGTLEKSLIV